MTTTLHFFIQRLSPRGRKFSPSFFFAPFAIIWLDSYGNLKNNRYFCTMCRFLAILLFMLGSALFGQGADAVAAPSAAQRDDISSLYVEQISASHRYNNTLHTTTTVCVPATSVTNLSMRLQRVNLDICKGSSLLSVATNCCYCADFSAYLLTGRRAIDYFLYKLCRLRL